MIRHIAFALVIIGLLCGTAHSGDRFALPTPDPEREQVIVFRLRAFNSGAIPQKVLLDGEHIASLRNNQYIVLPLDPGSHTLKMIWGLGQKDGPEVPIEAIPGNQRFFTLDFHTENETYSTYDAVWTIIPVARERALELIKPCKLKPLPNRRESTRAG